ncbi:mechanosensitive ion channel family protein [Candidatus Saccharibacteria bacterium]|nr:mechanosensitive ion channel family protein [Candidatus Saccharibacteria bacterium]
MDTVGNIFENIWVKRIFWSLIVIIANTLIYSLISHIISRREKKNSRIFSNKRNRTYLKMLKSVCRYVLIIASVIAIMNIFGIDTSSMLAGVGIVGVVIGFAIQDALKDIIKGFDIISDNYYAVGDIIKFNGLTGKVLTVGLKTTKIQEVLSGNIISIANRNIEQVEVVSGNIMIDVPLPYELSVKKAETVLNDAIKEIEKDEDVESVELLGLTELGSSALNYKIKIVSTPEKKGRVRRSALKTIVETLESRKISIPYNQLDIHQK